MEPKYTFKDLTEEEKNIVRRHFKKTENGFIANLVKIVDQNGNYLVTVNESFKDIKHLWYNFNVRPDDVWVITSPKCGTTWTQETTWHLMNGVKLERTSEPLFARTPFLDMVTILGRSKEEAEAMFKKFDEMPSPRTIKSHFPLQLLPPNLLETCKVIFVNRNVKDAAVSYFHHLQLMAHSGFDSEFEDFVEEIYPTGLCYGGGGPAYFAMMKCQYENIGNPNVLMLWYEDMKKDQRGMVETIKNHIGYEVSDEKIDQLTEFMKFENYQKTSSVNKRDNTNWKGNGQFIRKGIVGDWKNHFKGEEMDKWNEWVLKEFEHVALNKKEVLNKIQDF